MEEYNIFFPSPEEIFKKYEPPVVKFEDSFLFCYGVAGLEEWIQKTFGMKLYEPKVSDEKIRKTIEDIIKEKGIDSVKLKRVLIDRYNNGCLIVSSKLPRPVPIIDENGEEILTLWLTPYERKCYLISPYETQEIDLKEILRFASYPSFEEFLERVENYFKTRYSDTMYIQ